MQCEHAALLNFPCHDPSNFSLLHQRQPGKHRKDSRPRTYIATHSTLPPPEQVINTESQSILLRQFYQLGIKKDQAVSGDPSQTGSQKRAAEDLQAAVLKRQRDL